MSSPQLISIKRLKCRIVYVCRSSFDVIVFIWHFINNGHLDHHSHEWTMEECVEIFCKVQNRFGQFWDHVLRVLESRFGESKVLFFKYEALMEDNPFQEKFRVSFLQVGRE